MAPVPQARTSGLYLQPGSAVATQWRECCPICTHIADVPAGDDPEHAEAAALRMIISHMTREHTDSLYRRPESRVNLGAAHTMRPSIGRVVHYVSYGTPGSEYTSECRAAIVTEVGEVFVPHGQSAPEGTPVGVAVLNPTGMFFNRGVMQDEHAHAGGTWHWPERVD